MMDDGSADGHRPGPTKPYHHGALRDTLLEAATAMLERVEPDKLSLRGVARAAGVSQSAPYRHFASKKALLAEVAREGFIRFRHAMMSAGAGSSDPQTSFVRMGTAYVMFAVRYPGLFRLMVTMSGVGDQEFEDVQTAWRAALDLLLESSADLLDATGRNDLFDPDAYAMNAWGRVHGLAGLIIDNQIAMPADQPLEQAIGNILRGGRTGWAVNS